MHQCTKMLLKISLTLCGNVWNSILRKVNLYLRQIQYGVMTEKSRAEVTLVEWQSVIQTHNFIMRHQGKRTYCYSCRSITSIRVIDVLQVARIYQRLTENVRIWLLNFAPYRFVYRKPRELVIPKDLPGFSNYIRICQTIKSIP